MTTTISQGKPSRLRRFGEFVAGHVLFALFLVFAAVVWETEADGVSWVVGFTMLALGICAAAVTGDDPTDVDPDRIRLAISDPGAYVDRGPDSALGWATVGVDEPLSEWQLRAVLAAVQGEPTRFEQEQG